MNFFTSDWWFGDRRDAEDVFGKYEAYLASVRDLLPTQLLELHEEHTLHDGRIEAIACLFANKRVEMIVAGWNRPLSKAIQYKLIFLGVSRFEQSLPSGRDCDVELGDLGYWEAKALPSATEVRMLFASSAEFILVFEDFTFSHAQAPPDWGGDAAAR